MTAFSYLDIWYLDFETWSFIISQQFSKSYPQRFELELPVLVLFYPQWLWNCFMSYVWSCSHNLWSLSQWINEHISAIDFLPANKRFFWNILVSLDRFLNVHISSKPNFSLTDEPVLMIHGFSIRPKNVHEGG